MARFGGRPRPDDRFLTAAKPPARSNTVGSGILMASARKENALTMLLLPEALRPTRIVGLSNSI